MDFGRELGERKEGGGDGEFAHGGVEGGAVAGRETTEEGGGGKKGIGEDNGSGVVEGGV